MATVGRETLRQRLTDILVNNTVINEVFVEPTQQPGEPDLMGVTVVEVQGDFVVFNQAGSPGMGRIIVLLDSIIALDLGAI